MEALAEKTFELDIETRKYLDKQRAEFYEAFAKFQENYKAPGKNSTVKVPTRGGGSYEFKYTSLDDLIKAIVSVASPLGISYSQEASVQSTVNVGETKSGKYGNKTDVNVVSKIQVNTIIQFKNGYYKEFPSIVFVSKNGEPKEAGSAETYARRYSLAASFGVASEEDNDIKGLSGNYDQGNYQPTQNKGYGKPSGNQQQKPRTQVPTAEQLNTAKMTITKKAVELDKMLNLSSGTTSSLLVNTFKYDGDTTDVNLIKEVNNYLTKELETQKKSQPLEGATK